ncbi:hypothetical protein CFOL_v3_00806 [Cephalotus follicularis]|uniref:Uncharacterized protein n=1 Tax=Cephalotus follicularis TaxID=3775 RepID=A0A1Q3ANF6_CEPFO|nr:hypothetical protein CFOL_v3_00806 [Cephalotus follicularis]
MEESRILWLSKCLGSFCSHLQSSCDALKQSVQRRPVPLDSASSTFIQCLNRRVSTASSDLNLLESMSFGTVSLEELLGHCNEVYKTNQTHLLHLQHRLNDYGYVSEVEIDEEVEDSSLSTPLGMHSKFTISKDGLDSFSPASAARAVIKSLEEDPLLDESMSLKNLGISEISLATLASGGGKIDDPEMSLLDSKFFSLDSHMWKKENEPKSVEAPGLMVKVSKDDYESLPSYMKSLSSWEDLIVAVEKMNSNLSEKDKKKGYNYFHQDEIASLGLGPKGRAYLLLLVRMNRLVVEAIDGAVSYRVL